MAANQLSHNIAHSLQRLDADRSLLRLPLKTVRQLDDYLSNEWQITLPRKVSKLSRA